MPLHSATDTFARPHVIRLVQYIRVPRAEQRKISRRALFGIVVVALLAGAGGAVGASSALPGHAIVVTGQGSVTTTPDRAQLSLGVTSDGRTASAALRANAADMAKVIAAIKAQGIAAADIQTAFVSLNVRYNPNGDAVVGYTASNSVSVTVRTLAKTGPVIDAAV